MPVRIPWGKKAHTQLHEAAITPATINTSDVVCVGGWLLWAFIIHSVTCGLSTCIYEVLFELSVRKDHFWSTFCLGQTSGYTSVLGRQPLIHCFVVHVYKPTQMSHVSFTSSSTGLVLHWIAISSIGSWEHLPIEISSLDTYTTHWTSLDWIFISIESTVVLHRLPFPSGLHLCWLSCTLLATIRKYWFIYKEALIRVVPIPGNASLQVPLTTRLRCQQVHCLVTANFCASQPNSPKQLKNLYLLTFWEPLTVVK